MKSTITIKYRLYPRPRTAEQFLEFTKYYAKSCSYVSRIYFDNGTNLSMTKLHNKVYRYIRNVFGLKAQEADSVPRTVKARYKSANTQLFRNYRSYRDNYTKKYFHLGKNVQDLWHPIHFHTPQADLVYKNDWRVLPKQNKISVNTLNERAKVSYYLPKYFRKYLKMSHKLGTAKLIHKQGRWYLHASCTIDVPEITAKPKCIVGSDRGQRFLYYTYDGKHSKSLSGLRFRKWRGHFLKQRKILQHKHTKSSKRKLRQIGQRENCWMSLVNHQASKALVEAYPKDTAFVLENLRGVKFAAENAPKKTKYGRTSWTFYEFGTYLTYKARLHQCKVIHINPKYTSQRCPKCGHVLAESRHHHIHTYICKYCGYKSNDDRIGGMNIRYLGKRKIFGEKHPSIKLTS